MSRGENSYLGLYAVCNERITKTKEWHCAYGIACPLQMIVSVADLPPDEFDRHFTDSGYSKSYGPTEPTPIEEPIVPDDKPDADLLS